MPTTGIRNRHLKAAYLSYHRLQIGWQLAIFLACILPLVWGLIAFELKQTHTTAEYESNRDTHNLAMAFAEEVNATISSIDLSLIGLRTQWAQNPQEFRSIFERLQSLIADKVILQVSITDAKGILVFSSADPKVSPVDLSDREHIRVHQQGTRDRLFISQPVLGRISKKWTIQFTRPVYAADGTFAGVIVASVETAYFSNFYQQVDLGQGSAIALTKHDGTVLARSPHQDQGKGLGARLTGPAFQRDTDAPFGKYQRYSLVDGIYRFYSWRTLPQYGLIVVVGQSKQDAFSRYAEQYRVYLWGGGVISALLAILGYILLAFAKQRDRSINALAESEARWKFALEGAGDGVWDWDFSSMTAKLSRRAQEILQFDSDTLPCTPQTLETMVHPDDLHAVNKALRLYFERLTPSYWIEHRVRQKNGSWIWILSRGMTVKWGKDGRPERMVGTFTDITERKTREELISHMAQYDSLTDLPNRALFNDRLLQALTKAKREGSKVALLYFDLDKFKPVNDTHGHETGDHLLKAVADRVRQCLRQSDTMARIGGDEFVVMLSNINAESDATTVAANILERLNTPFEINGHTLFISGSMGIAIYPTDAEEAVEMKRCADRAMYQAKAGGGNRAVVYSAEVLHPPAAR